MPISPPVQITVPFATSGLKNTIPATTNNVTGTAGYDAGFGSINMTPKTAGGIPPYGQDVNGIFYDVTLAIRFLEAGGSFPYSSAFSTAVGGYPIGAIVSRTDSTGLWRNTSANNTTDPEAGGAGWQPEDAGSTAITMTSSNVTLTSLQASKSILVITGTLTTNLNLILPIYIKQWIVVNNGAGAFTVTVKTSGGSGVVVSTGATQYVYGDGTNINANIGNSSQTLSVGVAALAQHAAQFGQLSGVVGSARNASMSLTAANASGTFTADEIIVETALGGLQYRLASFSKTINLATTGAGGMDTGTAPVSGFVAVYAIYNPTSQTAALLAVNASAAVMPNIYGGANMPAGYTASGLVSVWPTTAAQLLSIGFQNDRTVAIPAVLALNNASVVSLTSLTITGAVPRNARFINGYIQFSSTSAASLNITLYPSALVTGGGQPFTLSVTASVLESTGFSILQVAAPGVIGYATASSAGTPSFQIFINSYIV